MTDEASQYLNTPPARDEKCYYEFGPFRLDTAERQLWRDDEEIPLTPKAYAVLNLLIRHSGRTLSKEDFMREVWADSFVEEKNLTDNISILRQALGDDAKNQKYIRTIPRRGYRFMADVREIKDGEIDFILHERSRAHIVVHEESAEPAANTSPEKQTSLREQPSGGDDLPEEKTRWWTRPFFIISICALVAALSFAGYLLLRNKTRVESTQTSSSLSAKSIAVLPFKPLTAESRDEYLELGMADALITKLSNIRQITVRPTTSVMKYKGEGLNLRTIGSELGVDVLLDGRVQKVGDRIRLSVQLVRASDAAPVWGENFDENLTDVFALQDRVSQRVASALSLKLTGEEKKGLAKRYTDNVEAYQLYVQGRAQWSSFSPSGLMTSINYYRAALEKDSNYALAYAGIAGAYNVIGIYGPLTAREAGPKAREAAEKAIELDDQLSQAHLALGTEKLLYEWDWEGARRELMRAIELDPNTDGHAPYAYYLEAMRRSDESLAELKRAKNLAPGWELANSDYAWHLFIERRYDEAIGFSEQELRLNPDSAAFYMVLGMVHAQQGKYDQAVSELRRGSGVARQRDANAPLFSEAELGVTYALMGRRQDALKQVALVQKSRISWAPFWAAEIYTALGEKDTAFAWLEKGYEARFPFLWEVRSYPQFDSLRDDPRYGDFLRRINLSP
jgi:DNA-binding winged helix-turn-helix (wHTH) protein/TolB-like protein/Tfp pilus assembly protein PilF